MPRVRHAFQSIGRSWTHTQYYVTYYNTAFPPVITATRTAGHMARRQRQWRASASMI